MNKPYTPPSITDCGIFEEKDQVRFRFCFEGGISDGSGAFALLKDLRARNHILRLQQAIRAVRNQS